MDKLKTKLPGLFRHPFEVKKFEKLKALAEGRIAAFKFHSAENE